MRHVYEVEVTVIGTATVNITANSEDEAMALACDQVTILHAEDWQYDATGVREHWLAETPDEGLVIGA